MNAEISENVNTYTHAPNLVPYGPGNDVYAPQIALGESWAYYMGYFMTDLKYGLKNSQPQVEQPSKYFYNQSTTSANITVLEGFNPNYTSDPFRWIPTGIYQDLRDAANVNDVVVDNVSGYTNQQMFGAFASSVTTLSAYKTRLLQTTTNPTSTNVSNLFAQYGY